MDKTERKQLIDKLEEDESFLSRYRCYSRVDKKKAWKQFCQQTRIPFYLRISRRQWIRYAALWILPIGMITALSLYRILPEEPALFYVEGMMSRIQNEATLTLADGTVVSLDSAANGLSLQQQTAEVMIASSQIKYQQASHKTQQTEYNTLSTNTDRKYDIVLEDGTHVYLNASSRLTYPLVFPADKRVVRLEGEAYFVVSKNPDRPFVVNLNGPAIHVLGTSFDVNAYPDNKDITVCLDEGHINLMLPSDKKYPVRPGERLVYNRDDDRCTISRNSDTRFSSLWKTNVIAFKDAPLAEVIKVLHRWYNVNFKVENQDAWNVYFTLTSENTLLEKVLRDLEKIAPLHFRYDEVEKEVTVTTK